jgi:hypothetical protein
MPRFIASLRAKFSAVTNSLALAVNRLLAIISVKLGMAIPNSIAAMAMVTISSIRVNPEWCSGWLCMVLRCSSVEGEVGAAPMPLKYPE